jgi:hypothetical protein
MLQAYRERSIHDPAAWSGRRDSNPRRPAWKAAVPKRCSRTIARLSVFVQLSCRVFAARRVGLSTLLAEPYAERTRGGGDADGR